MRARLGLSPDETNDRIDPEQTATMRQARAVLNEAHLSRERAVTLVEQDVIARAEYDTVNATYQVALSRYQDTVEEVRNQQALMMQRRAELGLAEQQYKKFCLTYIYFGRIKFLMNLLSTNEAAQRLGVSARRVLALIEKGKLAAQKVGRDYAIEERALESVKVYGKPGRPPKQTTLVPKSSSEIRPADKARRKLNQVFGKAIEDEQKNSKKRGGKK